MSETIIVTAAATGEKIAFKKDTLIGVEEISEEARQLRMKNLKAELDIDPTKSENIFEEMLHRSKADLYKDEIAQSFAINKVTKARSTIQRVIGDRCVDTLIREDFDWVLERMQ